MITLDSSQGSITLPNECIWFDEFEWTNIKAKSFYSITGDLIVEPAFTSKGRPITLGGDNAIMQRSDLLELIEWTNVLNLTMVLTLHDGRSFNVIFRYWDVPVVQGTMPKQGYSAPEDEYYYILTLKLVGI